MPEPRETRIPRPVKTTAFPNTSAPRALAPKTEPVALLRAAIDERAKKNPNYSLRAFARASGISHTVLSLVLSGKRPLSKKAALKLADHLNLDPKQRRKVLKPYESVTPKDYSTLSLDTFSVISDWYHYPILSLLELPNAKFEARWIAKRLGISILDAKLAMERLQRLDLVEEIDGRMRQKGAQLKIDNQSSTVATRRFHQQLLVRANQSIEQDDPADRSFSSVTLAMDISQVEYAKERIKEFRRQLATELETRSTPNAVYFMNFQLFPVAKSDAQETP